jgi:hypothetical protein
MARRTGHRRNRGLRSWAVLLCAAAALSAGVPAGSPAQSDQAKPAKPQIEICFVLDTTGSMSGLIEGAKQKIWSIANEMISAKPTPDIKIGLVAFRDRGDEYVTKSFDLSDDLDAIYGHLRSFRAEGGGDTPESVNEALHDAVHKMSWNARRDVLKIIFLVGDAPPHNYPDGPRYPDVCQEAVKKDIIINTVQCGTMPQTTPVWKEIAQLSEGSYVAIPQSGGMVAIATPLDAELARLNRELNKTVIAYGDERVRRAVAGKVVAAEAAPAAVAADRLSYSFQAGPGVVTGGGELLGELAGGRLDLKDVRKEQLPAELQTLSEDELRSHIADQQGARAELRKRILALQEKRQAFIGKEQKRLAAEGQGDSFDAKVAEMVRSQAARKGIHYSK